MDTLIKDKIFAIVLSILTFIGGSVLITMIIFYIARMPLSSLWENQLYVFFAILLSAILASMVYGRGSKQRAEEVADLLNEKLEISIEGGDIAGMLKLLERFPPFVVNSYVSTNVNAVKEFEAPIKKYISHLSDEDLIKLNKVMEMPISRLQEILYDLYLKTGLEQFKILAESNAKPLIQLNLNELKKILDI